MGVDKAEVREPVAEVAVLDEPEVTADEVAETLVEIQVRHSVGAHLHQMKTIDAALRQEA
jgi:hypothetical protein